MHRNNSKLYSDFINKPWVFSYFRSIRRLFYWNSSEHRNNALSVSYEEGNANNSKDSKKGTGGTTCSSRRIGGGRGKLSVCISAWTGRAHNFILSSLGLYLDLLAGRWTRYFGFIYGPRHAAASRGKVASVASARPRVEGGSYRKDPPLLSIYLYRWPGHRLLTRDHSGNKHPSLQALNATVSKDIWRPLEGPIWQFRNLDIYLLLLHQDCASYLIRAGEKLRLLWKWRMKLHSKI